MGLFGNKYKKSVSQIKDENVERINKSYNRLIRENVEFLIEEEKRWGNAMNCGYCRPKLGSIERFMKTAKSDAEGWGGQFVLESDLNLAYQRFKRQYDEYLNRERIKREEEERKKAEEERKRLEERQRKEVEQLRRKQVEQDMLVAQQQIAEVCQKILYEADYTDVKLNLERPYHFRNHEPWDYCYRSGCISAKKNEENYTASFGLISPPVVPYAEGHTLLKKLATILANVDISNLETRNDSLRGAFETEQIKIHENRQFEMLDDSLTIIVDHFNQEVLFKLYTSKIKKIRRNIDTMEGHEFEYFCAEILKKNGYEKVNVTQGSGDQGIDIIAFKDGIKYGIQCKCYSSDIGNKAVQEVFAGKTFYECHIGIVLTNQYFTKSAKDLAKKNGVILWDREKLLELIEKANCDN